MKNVPVNNLKCVPGVQVLEGLPGILWEVWWLPLKYINAVPDYFSTNNIEEILFIWTSCPKFGIFNFCLHYSNSSPFLFALYHSPHFRIFYLFNCFLPISPPLDCQLQEQRFLSFVSCSVLRRVPGAQWVLNTYLLNESQSVVRFLWEPREGSEILKPKPQNSWLPLRCGIYLCTQITLNHFT